MSPFRSLKTSNSRCDPLSERNADELCRTEKPWLDGKHTFCSARIIALVGDKDSAVELMRKAITQGSGISEVPDA